MTPTHFWKLNLVCNCATGFWQHHTTSICPPPKKEYLQLDSSSCMPLPNGSSKFWPNCMGFCPVHTCNLSFEHDWKETDGCNWTGNKKPYVEGGGVKACFYAPALEGTLHLVPRRSSTGKCTLPALSELQSLFPEILGHLQLPGPTQHWDQVNNGRASQSPLGLLWHLQMCNCGFSEVLGPRIPSSLIVGQAGRGW